MQSHTPIVQLRDSAEPIKSPNTQLAAALVTLGIELDKDIGGEWHVEIVEGKKCNETVWTLAPFSRDKRHDTSQLAKAWSDDAWLKANQTHPLAIMRAAFRSYKCRQTPDLALKEIITLDHGADNARDPALRAVSDEAILRRWASYAASNEPPSDPVTWAIQGFRNHKRLVAFIVDQQGPMAIQRRGQLIGVITRHTTPERRKQILQGLNA